MNQKQNWIDWVRDPSPIMTFEKMKDKRQSVAPSLNFAFPTRNIPTGLSVDIPEVIPATIDDRPCYIFSTDGISHGSRELHMAEPAAAQSASHLTVVWVKDNTEEVEVGYDTDVGVYPPKYAKEAPKIDTFLSPRVIPHRDDGFPAVLMFKGLRKWYKHNSLHRKGNQPAIKSDMVGAIWYENGKEYRPNGPSAVAITNYEEFHKDNIYHGHRFGDIFERWEGAKLPVTEGVTRPFENTYFGDPQEELAFVAKNCS